MGKSAVVYSGWAPFVNKKNLTVIPPGAWMMVESEESSFSSLAGTYHTAGTVGNVGR
jgi:hypothetical protein